MTRRQVKSVMSTTPAPAGVMGKALAIKGIIVKKTVSIVLNRKLNARARRNIHNISNIQITMVRADMGISSFGLGHIPDRNASIILRIVSGSQPGTFCFSRTKTNMATVATTANMQPIINAQVTDAGIDPLNRCQDASAARPNTTQASRVRRKRIDPRADERLIPQLIRAR